MAKTLSENPKAAYMRRYNKTAKGAIYTCWRHIVRRCCDPSHKSYPCYGGRGICMCEEWKSYDSFYQWAIKSGWSVGLQIDRRDNALGYFPENCHWVTSRQNNRNRSNNKLNVEKVAEIRRQLQEGVKGPVLARKFGVHHSLIYRIKLNKQWL